MKCSVTLSVGEGWKCVGDVGISGVGRVWDVGKWRNVDFVIVWEVLILVGSYDWGYDWELWNMGIFGVYVMYKYTVVLKNYAGMWVEVLMPCLRVETCRIM